MLNTLAFLCVPGAFYVARLLHLEQGAAFAVGLFAIVPLGIAIRGNVIAGPASKPGMQSTSMDMAGLLKACLVLLIATVVLGEYLLAKGGVSPSHASAMQCTLGSVFGASFVVGYIVLAMNKTAKR